MNLMPIDSGGTPPELVGVGTSPGGDFAALMTGLMAGDTQIVPLLDLPVGEQPTGEAETTEEGATADPASWPLDFIGAPPSGMVMNAPIVATAQAALTVANEATAESIEGAAVPVAVAQASESATTQAAAGAAVDSVTATGLATVHPISTQAVASNRPRAEASAHPLAGAVGHHPLTEAVSDQPAPETDIGTPVLSPERTPGIEPQQAQPTPIAASTPAAVDESAFNPGPAARHTESTVHRIAAGEPPAVQPEFELDTGAVNPPLETARPVATMTQPAMVGIARRVEEAIAALASKPDPKIVTLQLDEFDGLRLTVALRPDGIHLSSSGDAALTNEIERALASRGFDMASNGEGRRQAREESPEDGWRPRPAPTGRPNRSNPSGIRL